MKPENEEHSPWSSNKLPIFEEAPPSLQSSDQFWGPKTKDGTPSKMGKLSKGPIPSFETIFKVEDRAEGRDLRRAERPGESWSLGGRKKKKGGSSFFCREGGRWAEVLRSFGFEDRRWGFVVLRSRKIEEPPIVEEHTISANLSNPKPGHTMGGSGRGGTWRGGEAERGRAGRDADVSLRPENNCSSYPPVHRRKLS